MSQSITHADILYADPAVVICCKQPGMLSEPGKQNSLPERLSAYFRQQGQKDYIATVHRLDKPVGGVMVFSREKQVTGVLAAAVAGGEMKKEYFAVLRGSIHPPAGILEDLLFRDSAKNKTYVVHRMRKGVRPAKLEYRLLAQTDCDGQQLSLVWVRLFTGRTHQIRAQFAARQLPLLGDVRYGSNDPRCDVSLWSCYLSLPHPLRGELLDAFCPPPECFPWSLFPMEAFTALTPFIY